MSTSDDIPSESDRRKKWRKELWASLDAKRKEQLQGGPTWDYESHKRAYEADKEGFIRERERRLQVAYQNVQRGLANGYLTEASASGNPAIVEMQKTIDNMANDCGEFKTLPRLVIHGALSPKKVKGTIAYVVTPRYIETNEEAIDYFLRYPEQGKAIFAHEMGHIANGDMSIETRIEQLTTPPNRKAEMLADRKGALIFGNPRKYAEAVFLFSTRSEPGASRPEHHIYSTTHPSHHGGARMLHKWAEILENEGAADKITGEIIDREKAQEVFQRSKEFAEDLLKIR